MAVKRLELSCKNGVFRQTDRWTDGQTDGQTGRQTDGKQITIIHPFCDGHIKTVMSLATHSQKP